MAFSSLVSGSSEPAALLAAVTWFQAVLLGAPATAIAIVAVAALGIAIMAGRIDLRRGATTTIGCFILFGAPAIAAGIMESLSAETVAIPVAQTKSVTLPSSPYVSNNPAFDPYAGAAMPTF